MRARAVIRAALLALALGSIGLVRAEAQSIPVKAGTNASSLLGVDFDLPIVIDMTQRTERLGSFALSVRWNPSVLEMVGGGAGDFGGQIEINDDSLLAGALLVNGVNAAGIDSVFSVIVARLRPLVDDTATIQISVQELYAADTFADLTADAVASNSSYCVARGRYGDGNHDDAANSFDALLAISASINFDVSPNDPTLLDVDGINGTGATDALIILSHAVGLDVSPFRVMQIAPGACATSETIAGFQITPGDLTVLRGQRVDYHASATDASGTTSVISDIFWRVSDQRVATVTADGTLAALAPGVTDVTAVRNGTTDSATATLTVENNRDVHWVDVRNYSDANRLGTLEYPFAQIQRALDIASDGDTVRVLPGRYHANLQVRRGVVIYGDTATVVPAPGVAAPAASRDLRPFLAAEGVFSIGIDVRGDSALDGMKVELHNFWLDTLYYGIDARDIGALLVDNVYSEAGQIFTLDVSHVAVQNSALHGRDGGINARSGDSLTVQSTSLLSSAIFADDVTKVSLRDVDVDNNSGSSFFNVYVTDNDQVDIANSTFVGPGADFFFSLSGIYARSVKQFSLDSSTVEDFGWDGVELDHVDSVFVRNSTIARNYSRALTVCNRSCFFSEVQSAPPPVAAVFTGNRIDAGQQGAIDIDDFRSATFDHNVITGGMQLDGRRPAAGVAPSAVEYASVVTFLGDSVDAYNSSWLYLLVFDSLWADSLAVRQVHGQGTLHGGRTATFENSAFRDLEWAAIDIDAISPDSSWLFLRNVSFTGPDSVTCNRCARGVESFETIVDAQDITGVNLYSAFDHYYKKLTLTNASFTHNYYDVDSDCGSVAVTNLTSFDTEYSIMADGCPPATDSLTVDGSNISFSFRAIDSYDVATTVTNTVLTDVNYGIQAYDGAFVATDNQIVRPAFRGIDFDPNGVGTAQALRNTITCSARGAASAVAIEGYDTEMTVADNVIDGCFSGITVDASTGLLVNPVSVTVRNNTVTLPATKGNYGIWADGTKALIDVVGNSVSGPANNGSVYAGGFAASVPLARLDSNTVTASFEYGIWARDIDSLYIRDNTVTGHTGGSLADDAAIYLGFANNTATKADVRRNRVETSASSGIVVDRSSSLDTVTVTVDSNVVRNVDSLGIWVDSWSRAVVRWNAIDSSGQDAIKVSQFNASFPAVANNNNLTASGRYGINNTSGFAIDGKNNWWNDALGPSGSNGDVASTGDSVSTNVTFAPFRTTTAATPPLVAPAPAFAALRAPRTSVGADRFTRIEPLVLPRPQLSGEEQLVHIVRSGGLQPPDDVWAERIAEIETMRTSLAEFRAEQRRIRDLRLAERIQRTIERDEAAAAKRAARRAERAERRERKP